MQKKLFVSWFLKAKNKNEVNFTKRKHLKTAFIGLYNHILVEKLHNVSEDIKIFFVITCLKPTYSHLIIKTYETKKNISKRLYD